MPTGTEIKRTKTLVTFEVTPDELSEWRADADYYSDCTGQGWSMGREAIGLQSSARATVNRIHEKLLTHLVRRPLADSSAERVFVHFPATPKA